MVRVIRDWSRWQCDNIRVRRHTSASLLLRSIRNIFSFLLFLSFFLLFFIFSLKLHTPFGRSIRCLPCGIRLFEALMPQGMSRWHTLLLWLRMPLQRCVCIFGRLFMQKSFSTPHFRAFSLSCSLFLRNPRLLCLFHLPLDHVPHFTISGFHI